MQGFSANVFLLLSRWPVGAKYRARRIHVFHMTFLQMSTHWGVSSLPAPQVSCFSFEESPEDFYS